MLPGAAVDAEELARKSAQQEQELQEEQAAATVIQTKQRGIIAKDRVEKKRNAVPVETEDYFGATVWEIQLVKTEESQRFGFSHASAKAEMLKDYAKALTGIASNKSNNKQDNNLNNSNNSNISNEATNVKIDPNTVLSSAECPEALVVKRVSDQGLLEEWNFIHPEAEVRPGDQVIAVNGAKTIQDMQKQLRSNSCVCRILRLPEVFARNWSSKRANGNWASSLRSQ